MTADDFRTCALAQPGAVEASHMGHADFRVGGKIFAGLAKAGVGTLNLQPEEQALAMAISPAFTPAAGAWGHKGWTSVDLDTVTPELMEDFITKAWQNVAPKRLRG